MRPVDLDLFVNSASKGFNDGAKVPTPFAAFVSSFVSGIDADQKYEAQDLQDQQRQIAIDQAPIDTRIKEAEAKTKEADAKVVTDHPDEYEAAKLADLNAKAANDQATAIINNKKSQLTQIMDGDDPIAKGQALASGKFDSIMTETQKKQYIQQSYPDWADEDKQTYDDQVHAQQTRDWTDAANKQAVEKAPEYSAALTSDPNIQNIKNQIPGNVSYPDLLTKGTIATVSSYRVPSMVKDPATGAQVPELDDFGNQVFKNSTKSVPPPGAKLEERKVFQYDGQQYDIGGTGLSSDTYKTFNNAQSNYAFVNQRNLGQFYGDVKKSDQDTKEAKAKIAADATAQYEQNASEVRSQQDAFTAGAEIKPPYVNAARRVYQSINDSRNNTVTTPESVANSSSTPDLTVPDLTVQYPPSAPQVPALPEGREASPATSLDATPASSGTPIPSPTKFTITPGTASPVAVGTLQANQTSFATSSPTPAPSGSEATPTPAPLTQQEEDLAKSKALAKQKALNALQNQGQKVDAPVTPSPTPVDQARQVATSSFVPSKFTVNVPVSYAAPNAAGIQKVAAAPEMQGLSAAAKAVAVTESRGNNDAVSPTGVKGMMQVTKGTAKEISDDIDRTNPVQNAIGGAIYVEKLLSDPAFENNPMLAFTSYNAGEGTVAKAVQLAQSTDWDRVKNFIEPAIMSNSAYWRSIGVDPKQKAIEARQYAEKVVANFGSFVYTPGDMSIANKLKQQKVLSF